MKTSSAFLPQRQSNKLPSLRLIAAVWVLLWSACCGLLSVYARSEPVNSGAGAEAADKGAVKQVVQDLLQAVRKADWVKTAGFFCADFHRYHDDIASGGLLRYDPHSGQVDQAILAGPSASVREVTIRGDRAWASVLPGDKFVFAETAKDAEPPDQFKRSYMATLELIKDNDAWRLLRFPSSDHAIDGLRAETADEKTVREMLSDRVLDKEEQARLAGMLAAKRYYMVSVQGEENSDVHRPILHVYPASAYGMRGLTNTFDGRIWSPRAVCVSLWGEPSEDVSARAKSIAKDMLSRLYKALASAKDRFPELAKWDQAHATLSDHDLWYCPDTPRRLPKSIPESSVDISVRIAEPMMYDVQPEAGACLYFPNLKLVMIVRLKVQDERLAEFVKETIKKELRSGLSDFNARASGPGSSPVSLGF